MEEKYHVAYNDLIQIFHINLDYLKNKDYNEIVKENNELMKTLYFLVCNDDKVLDIVYERDDLMKDLIKEAREKAGIKIVTAEDWLLDDDELIEQVRNEGRAEGKAEGRAEGKAENQREMIINLYNNNVSLDIISKSSGLSIDEIKKIISTNN